MVEEKTEVTITQRFSALLSRKFLVAVGAVVVVTFCLEIDPQTKLDTITWIVGLFLGANVAQKGVLNAIGMKKR